MLVVGEALITLQVAVAKSFTSLGQSASRRLASYAAIFEIGHPLVDALRGMSPGGGVEVVDAEKVIFRKHLVALLLRFLPRMKMVVVHYQWGSCVETTEQPLPVVNVVTTWTDVEINDADAGYFADVPIWTPNAELLSDARGGTEGDSLQIVALACLLHLYDYYLALGSPCFEIHTVEF